MRLKDISILNPQDSYGNIEGNVSFVPMESLRNASIDYKEISFSEAKGKYTYFGNEDLLIAKVTPCFENGNIAIARNMLQSIGFGSSEIFVLRMNEGVMNTYMFYVTQASDFKDKACSTMCGVGGLKRISPLFMRTYSLSIPSKKEQQKIVSYLDAKTAAIDKRIAVLEKKQEVYSRLRKSIINRAVTRGLNTNVPLKDSGVDWIRMIPEHWEVRRFKELFTNCTTGITPDSKNDSYFDTEEGYTWVTIGDMNGKYTSDSQLRITPKVTELFSPAVTPKGSLMFSFKLSIGKLSFAEKDLYTNEAIMSIRPTADINLDYIYYILPDVLSNNATENIYGAKMLNQKIIANMIMFVPPLPEQRAIADYLDEKCTKIDAAVANIGKQIDALKRLKRALINEVVTGKRKV